MKKTLKHRAGDSRPKFRPVKVTALTPIVDRLGGIARFAAIIGVSMGNAASMQHRGKIHARHWQAIIESPEGRKAKITYNELAEIHAE